MSDRRLRDDIRAYYHSKEPSHATVERLRAITAATGRHRSPGPRRLTVALNAAAVLLLVAGLSIVLRDRHAGASAEAIADEIAMNHNKRLDVELEATSYGELRRAMDRLDFSLVEPSRAGEHGLRLTGARYCSIRGQLAAQLRLETDDGEHVTLYQTALTGDLESLRRTRLRSGGLVIDLWQEDGVFLGMAQGP